MIDQVKVWLAIVAFGVAGALLVIKGEYAFAIAALGMIAPGVLPGRIPVAELPKAETTK